MKDGDCPAPKPFNDVDLTTGTRFLSDGPERRPIRDAT
jgi:hypothetical protein